MCSKTLLLQLSGFTLSLRLRILKTPVNPALASTFWFYIPHLVLSRGLWFILCFCLSLFLASLRLLLQFSHGSEPEFQCTFSDSCLIPYRIDYPGQAGQTSFWSRVEGLYKVELCHNCAQEVYVNNDSVLFCSFAFDLCCSHSESPCILEVNKTSHLGIQIWALRCLYQHMKLERSLVLHGKMVATCVIRRC